MTKLVYFARCGGTWDLIKNTIYTDPGPYLLEPQDSCIVIILSKYLTGGFDQLQFRGGDFLLSNKRPHHLCFYLKNLSSTLTIKMNTGCSLQSILKKSIVKFKVCHMSDQDLIQAQLSLVPTFDDDDDDNNDDDDKDSRSDNNDKVDEVYFPCTL